MLRSFLSRKRIAEIDRQRARLLEDLQGLGYIRYGREGLSGLGLRDLIQRKHPAGVVHESPVGRIEGRSSRAGSHEYVRKSVASSIERSS